MENFHTERLVSQEFKQAIIARFFIVRSESFEVGWAIVYGKSSH